MKKVIGLFLVMLLSNATLFAQEKKEDVKKGHGAMFEQMITELKLDEKQATEFRAINEEFMTKMRSQRDSMKEGENREAQFAKMKTLRDERNAKLQKIMTPEQFEKYQAKEKQRPMGRRPQEQPRQE